MSTIETSAGDGVAAYHVVARNLVDEFFVSDGHIGCALDGIPLHVLCECPFHGYVADHVASGIVVQQAVEADALDAGDETARRGEGLQSATGADTYHRQGAVLVALLTGLVVDVGKGVEFIDYDVDIIAADAV